MLGLDISPIATSIFFGFYHSREIWRLYQAEKRLSAGIPPFKIWLRYALSPKIIRRAAVSAVQSSGMMMGVEIV